MANKPDPISAKNPITAKPILVPAKDLDKFDLTSVSICVGLLNAQVVPYNDLGDRSESIQLDTIDLSERLLNDPAGLQAVAALNTWISSLFKEQGKLA